LETKKTVSITMCGTKRKKNFRIHTANTYGELRSLLFDKYAPNDKRKKNLRPEQLVDPITSLELGIQENDLWIAAQAIRWERTTHRRLGALSDDEWVCSPPSHEATED